MLSCFALVGLAEQAGANDLYLKKVKPLLAEKCVACHGPVRHEAGLRLDAVELIRRGGESGSILSQESPEKSELLSRVTHADPAERMPPEGEGVRLTKEEVDLVLQWLKAGLPAPENEVILSGPEDHWAFKPLSYLPPGGFSLEKAGQNPIDALLDAARQIRGFTDHGLGSIEPADRMMWLRRVTLDLTGLPPTIDELESYIADASFDSDERVVDRLLSSPAYGEKWGRNWMDVWRYSDWDGYKNELRGSQRHIYHWRDWIIESLNNDKPYDQMIVEMLAGDEIAPDDPNILRATGFLARNYHKSNRNIWLDATVEHTAKAFLGLTIACARCHEHKYDPITQQQYYEFRAIFEPHHVRADAVAGEADLTKSSIPRAYDSDLAIETFLYERGNEKQPRKDLVIQASVPLKHLDVPFEVTPVALPKFSQQPSLAPVAQRNMLAAAWQRVQQTRKSAESELAKLKEQDLAKADGSSATDNTDAARRLDEILLPSRAAEQALAALQARLDADLAKLEDSPPKDLNARCQRAAQLEQQAKLTDAELQVARARQALQAAEAPSKLDAKKKQAAIDKAKKELTAAEQAFSKSKQASSKEATEYTPVGPVYPKTSSGRRTALAKWITDPRNPLTPRVAVNHMWLRHFGKPLVDNISDFGLRSPQPELHTLLDWLASEFVRSGWDMKHLHRLMVLSHTYRLSSGIASPTDAIAKSDQQAKLEKLDPENSLYWRANVRRLDAEEIRDSLLAVTNELDRQCGGPDLEEDAGEKLPRRSVYFRHAYEKQVPMLVVFDGPSPNECYRRSPSIIPQQALALANSDLARRLSRSLGKRLSDQVAAELPQSDVVSEGESSPEGDQRYIDQLFMTVLNRPPRALESEACLRYLKNETSLLTKSSESQSESKPPARLQARQSLAHVLLNHNDFVVAR